MLAFVEVAAHVACGAAVEAVREDDSDLDGGLLFAEDALLRLLLHGYAAKLG